LALKGTDRVRLPFAQHLDDFQIEINRVVRLLT
jgi:hypothetical protein